MFSVGSYLLHFSDDGAEFQFCLLDTQTLSLGRHLRRALRGPLDGELR